MSLDRFVHFNDDIPTLEQLRWILEDYLGNFGTIDCQETHWFISLPGKPSFPFKRVSPELASFEESFHAERWFEVYVGSLEEGNIDVITRMQDELTNTIAQGFAQAVARYFKANLE